MQGFQTAPSDNFFVPYHAGQFEVIEEVLQEVSFTKPIYDVAGAGYMGTTHTERGLTFVTVNHAGHGTCLSSPIHSHSHVNSNFVPKPINKSTNQPN